MTDLPRSIILSVALLIVGGTWARADDLLPADRPIPEVVDHYLDARLAVEKLEPAPAIDDCGLIRRLMLDLVGRVPTAAEATAFAASREGEKRTRLVDRLLASPGFVRHQANEFDAMMMAGTRGSLRDYLAKALGENRPWDRIFREIVLADESAPETKGSSAFLKQRVRDLDRLTSDMSSTFFGVNISCAKCHDHPRVHDWKQDHFYGMKAFFSRTFDNGDYLGERGYGSIKFQTVKGQERQATMMFLTGRVVEPAGPKEGTREEQRTERKQFEEAKKKKVPPPRPEFSARARLADVALEEGERAFFARAIVNRLWHRFFGTGLVMPLDQMHSENPPSHPELLEWLARDLVAHQYDLRRLTRGLVLSKAYARSSRWPKGEPPDPQLFAVGPVRPLTPMQLATSMWVATTAPAALGGDLKPEELEKRIEGLEGRARGLADSFAKPGEDYQISVSEALLFSNGDRINDLLSAGGDRLVGRLKAIKDRDERISVAIGNVLSRAPEDDEFSLLNEFLAPREGRLEEGCRQLVWALLSSAEFRFNY